METQEQDKEWLLICKFGDGKILAKGDKRKIVTPGIEDFNYGIRPQLEQRVEPSSLPFQNREDKS